MLLATGLAGRLEIVLVETVDRAILASIRGPISSESWNANTASAQPGRSSTRWEPAVRLMVQPIRNRAARTWRARVDGHWLKRL